LDPARGGEQRTFEGTQKSLKPIQEQTEIVAGGGEHGLAAVASFEVIAAHPVLGFHMPNDQLDRVASAHLAGIGAVTPRTWLLIQTRNFCAWLWPR
jgi:hypothetical protein